MRLPPYAGTVLLDGLPGATSPSGFRALAIQLLANLVERIALTHAVAVPRQTRGINHVVEDVGITDIVPAGGDMESFVPSVEPGCRIAQS